MIPNLNRQKYLGRHGVYVIRNLETCQEYVGSTNDLYKRIGGHLSSLRKNRHENPYLQNSWNMYGESNFDVYVLFEYDDIELRKLRYIENKVIDAYKAMYYERGFNLKKADEDGCVEITPEGKASMIAKLSKRVEGYNVTTGEVVEFSSSRAAVGNRGFSDAVKEMRVAKGHFWFYSGGMNLEVLKKCFYKKNNPRPHKEKAKDRTEVLDLETGIFYSTISELAKANNTHPSTFHTRLMRGDFGTRYLITQRAIKNKAKK